MKNDGITTGFPDEQIYEVFARKQRADRFEHVGTITAPNRKLARVYAWQTYDEAKWFEMTVAPRTAFSAVNLTQDPFTLGGAPPMGQGSVADNDSTPGYGTPAES